MQTCFQLLFLDHLSFIGMYGCCEDSWLALNLLQSLHPSQPAIISKQNSKLMLMELQLAVLVLNHLYDVYGLCMDDQNSKESSLASFRIPWQFCKFEKMENENW